MAFFEQLGKTLTNAGQGVAQQTKNFTEITRLNGVISDKEKQIEQLYTIIGKAYYEAHKNDAFAESGDSIQRINDLLAEIARHKEEIKQIKGVTPCPACGAEVPASSAFPVPASSAFPVPAASFFISSANMGFISSPRPSIILFTSGNAAFIRL